MIQIGIQVDRIAGWLGLEQVGWVFTDLEDDGTKQGTVFYKRHKVSRLVQLFPFDCWQVF
jgi:hypothetical protein